MLSPWQFGYGRFESNRTASFTPLPHWTGSAWQGGPSLPDPHLGWVLLTPSGGHPDLPERSAIRRWTAPLTSVISITGSLSHSSPNGDGVRGRIVSSRSGLAGEWVAHNRTTETSLAELAVAEGDIIDFITDCRGSHTSDSFNWPVRITRKLEAEPNATFASETGFHGPLESAESLPAQAVRAWELALCREPTAEEVQLATNFLFQQLESLHANPKNVPPGKTATRQALANLCQSLLGSNEFLYVD